MLEAVFIALLVFLIITVLAVLIGVVLGLGGMAIVLGYATWPSVERRWIIPPLRNFYSVFPASQTPKHVQTYLTNAQARGLIQ
jgi:hypothetical protein